MSGLAVAAPSLSEAAKPEQPMLLLISLDGFRHDYLDKGATPNLDYLRTNGLQADGLIPVFPANTFPNHYSIVTGLYPVHHGIVDNRFYDPVLDASFDMYNAEAVRSDRWWDGEPIWVTAIRQGLKAGTLFWVGSEAEINGYRPTYWLPYEHHMPHKKRIEQVLSWIDLPPGQHPSFLTLYMHDVDSAGHDYGIDTPETREAIKKVDATIGVLIKELEKRHLLDKIHIIVVSDHGMTKISKERAIRLEDYIDTSEVQVVQLGTLTGLRVDKKKLPATLKKLKGAHPHMKVYTREEMPERFHYSAHIRVHQILCLADDGWMITSQKYIDSGGWDWSKQKGAHGYDNLLPNMRGIFIACGPSIPKGTRIEAFNNIEIYNFMCEILKIDPAPNDGSEWLVNQVDELRSTTQSK